MPAWKAKRAADDDTEAPMSGVQRARSYGFMDEEGARLPLRVEPVTGLASVRRLLSGGRLVPGDWVEVRSEAEITATLDHRGTLDELPFMPEMWRFTGRRFRVKSRADRTVVDGHGVRRMERAVHLDGLTCDGAGHGGCQRSCVLFWKEAWLRRVEDEPTELPPSRRVPLPLWRADGGGGTFCQATQLARATAPLPVYHVRPHLAALWGEDTSARDLGKSLLVLAHDLLQQRLLGGRTWAIVPGSCRGTTPSVSLGLVAGERVRVKEEREILATLDEQGKNRGLHFSREMLPFCGQEATVLRRCDRFIPDDRPALLAVKDTVLLEGLAYRALSRLAVPRGEYFFWRECWLERI